jgi:hypothetical protein
MHHEYLRAFVIGSSFLVFIPFFFIVLQFNPKKMNYQYSSYTFIAPFVLGLFNVFSLFIARLFHLSRRFRYLLISLLAPTVVVCTILFMKLYNFTKTEWYSYIWKLYLFYFVLFNINVYLLDKYV